MVFIHLQKEYNKESLTCILGFDFINEDFKSFY